jgi:hypothetical protein
MYEDLTLYIRFGAKGSGKSLLGAVMQRDFLYEYEEIKIQYPELKSRILFTGEKLCKELENEFLGKTLFYWSSPRQLKYCPRPNCWKQGIATFGIDYEHQNNPDGKHPVHDTDIYWPEVSRHFGADKSKDQPQWLKDMMAFCRKDHNRIFFDAQVFEDIAIAIRRQFVGGHAYLCQKIYGSQDLTATRPAPIEFTWWSFIKMWFGGKEVLWGRIGEFEFDPQLLEFERDPTVRDRIAGENVKTKSLWIKKEYVELYDTDHRIPPYRETLEHVELWCEKPDCKLHGHHEGKPKIEHYKI